MDIKFIKVCAYTLPHKIIIHVNIDFTFYQPMNYLFDAVRYNKDTLKGQAGCLSIMLEDKKYPDKVGSFLMMNWI